MKNEPTVKNVLPTEAELQQRIENMKAWISLFEKLDVFARTTPKESLATVRVSYSSSSMPGNLRPNLYDCDLQDSLGYTPEQVVFRVRCGYSNDCINFLFSQNSCFISIVFQPGHMEDLVLQLSSLEELQKVHAIGGKDFNWRSHVENQVQLNDGLLILKHWLHLAKPVISNQKPIVLME